MVLIFFLGYLLLFPFYKVEKGEKIYSFMFYFAFLVSSIFTFLLTDKFYFQGGVITKTKKCKESMFFQKLIQNDDVFFNKGR